MAAWCHGTSASFHLINYHLLDPLLIFIGTGSQPGKMTGSIYLSLFGERGQGDRGYLTAMVSISIITPSGSFTTPKAARAGGLSG